MKKFQNITDKIAPSIIIVILLIIWQTLSMINIIPKFMLPSPFEVVRAFISDFPLLMEHTEVTLIEAFLGLGLGIILGFAVAVIMDRFEYAYKMIYPVLVITQTIPTVAIAPLLVLWMGFGILPKVVLVAISTFFPVTVALISTFRSVDSDVIDLMRTMGAHRVQIFRHVKLPAAARQFFSGLQISVTYAVIGAVIAEWLGGDMGLGVYMTRVRKAFAYDRMFAAIVVVSALSLLLMWLVGLLKTQLMPWDKQSKNKVKGE